MSRRRLNDRIRELEDQIRVLTSLVDSITADSTEESNIPYSKIGNPIRTSFIGPLGISGMGGGKMIWNDIELSFPPMNAKPKKGAESVPQYGYNCHGHSRFSGGAMDINTMELVEYDIPLKTSPESGTRRENLFEWDSEQYSKHSQDYWQSEPSIATVQDSSGASVKKIGTLDIEFDPETRKWQTGSGVIDVESTQFVRRVQGGALKKDSSGNDMSSVLYSNNKSLTNVLWDEKNSRWRFYAVYADE